MREYILLFGGTLRKKGRVLGPDTQLRVRRAEELVEETGGVILVGSRHCPCYPQAPTAATLIRRYLQRQRRYARVIPMNTFDTYGEVEAYVRYTKPWNRQIQLTVVSAAGHLPRIRRIMSTLVREEALRAGCPLSREEVGEIIANVDFVASAERWSGKEYCLEVIRYAKTFLPRAWQETAVGWYRRLFGYF